MTPDQIRHALGHFATGVTVVTSLRAGGLPVGTTVSAVSSLSLEPPLLLVCLSRTSATLQALQAHGAFAINVLSAGQREVSNHFARSGSAAGWDVVPHRVSVRGLPVLTGALAVLECSLERCLDGGDHEIVIGRLRGLDVSDGISEPLLHYRGAYAGLAA